MSRHFDLLVSTFQVRMRRWPEMWTVRPERSRLTREERAEHDRFFPEDACPEHMTWGMRFVAVAAIVAGVWVVGLLLVLLGLVVFQ